MKKVAVVLGIIGLIGTMGISTTSQASALTGAVTYHHYHGLATIKKNYKHFSLTNHQPHSKYKTIKVFNWKFENLKAGSKVKIDCRASQGTQYDWYRIRSINKHHTRRYWVYGQALNLK